MNQLMHRYPVVADWLILVVEGGSHWQRIVSGCAVKGMSKRPLYFLPGHH